MASGSRRPGWHVPVLVLAGLLVVAQVIAFVVIRKNRDAKAADSATSTVATVLDAAEAPKPVEAPLDAQRVDIAVVVDAAPPPEVPTDATSAIVEKAVDKIEDKQPRPKKPTRAELLAQQKKEREDRKREDEQQRRDAQERERRKLEAERAAAEQAKLAAEVERQRLAKERADAETAALAEKARLEAAKQAAALRAEPKPEVLVLVLGPGTPAMSADQIRNVYLGRSSVWPNGTTARPLNRPSGTVAAKKFYGGVLKMGAGAFVEHWSELQLSGSGIAPGVVSSGKTLVAKVAATNGGFGYVMESELPAETSGVRLVRLN